MADSCERTDDTDESVLPSLFWFGSSDALLSSCAWLGALVSLVVLAGYANAPVLAGLWILYLSFVHVGQICLTRSFALF